MNSIDVWQAIWIAFFVTSFLLKTGRGFKAIELVQECLVLLNNADLGIEVSFLQYAFEIYLAQTFRIVANLCYDQSKYVTAKELIMKAIAIDIKINNKNMKALDYTNLGLYHRAVGQYFEAMKCYEEALEIVIELNNREVEAMIYGNLGNVFKCIGKYDQAKIYQEKALAIVTEIGDIHGEAACYGNLGPVFVYLGEFAKAEKHLEKALVILMKIGDRHGEATCYDNLGALFVAVGEYVKAKEYLVNALAIRKKIGDRRGEASSLQKLGQAFWYIGEHAQAKHYSERALQISMEIGDRGGEALSYGDLGNVCKSLGEYAKAKEYYEKALAIGIETGDKHVEGANYGNLAVLFCSLGKYVEAKEYQEKSLVINKKIGDRQGEAHSYLTLGALFQSLGEKVKAKEYYEKAHTIIIEIGDRASEAAVYQNLGMLFLSCDENARAKKYHEKALVIRKEIGDKKGEGVCYNHLGTTFLLLGKRAKAQEYYKKSLAIFKEIGSREGELGSYFSLGKVCVSLGEYVMAGKYLEEGLSMSKEIGDGESELKLNRILYIVKVFQRNLQEGASCLLQCLKKCEDLRYYLAGNDQFNISFSDEYGFPYRLLSQFYCDIGFPNEALYVVELGRARGLADLMKTKYHVKMEISANPESWVGMENIMKKESNCTCLYISYNDQDIYFWILKAGAVIYFRQKEVNGQMVHDRLIKNLDAFFSDSFRSFGIFSEGECEDRSLKDIQPNLQSPLEESLATFRLVEDDDEERQEPKPSLSLYYKLLIAPVVDLLQDREIVIVPDRFLYRVPFAALPDESGKYLSEMYRFRIVPSLTTLKLIQDSPADYHSHTGALIVGDPKVGQVMYKGYLEGVSRLPRAGQEAEIIGRLLGVEPLLGANATKHAVLQQIYSVSLIHFAAHGSAERGEIALAPRFTSSGIPEEEDYLLTMSDISQVQLRAKLVVLSCCHSGSGQIRTEGVVGIARAFLGSGARSVLVALWAIEDTATEQFMRLFYEHLVRGESASECLHEAMKWMRSNGYSEVAQWAPFMLIGDNVTLEFGK